MFICQVLKPFEENIAIKATTSIFEAVHETLKIVILQVRGSASLLLSKMKD